MSSPGSMRSLTSSASGPLSGSGDRTQGQGRTPPGLRALEKYAVRIGGSRPDQGKSYPNDGRSRGGAPSRATCQRPRRVDRNRSDEFRRAARRARSQPDVILLDNIQSAEVRHAVEQVRLAEDDRRERVHDRARKICIEPSGGITLANVREFAETVADWISVGALIHSAAAVDLSFEIEPA